MDGARRAKAKVSEEIATKPPLAREMIAEALQAGVPCRWVTADCVYGGDSWLRRLLEKHSLSYVVAVTGTQKLRSLNPERQEVRDYADRFAETDWRKLSCGRGTKVSDSSAGRNISSARHRQTMRA